MSTRLLSRLGAPALLRTNPQHVPATACVVDPAHPLARGLVCFYAPAVSFSDLNGLYPTLKRRSSADVGLTASPVGGGFRSTTTGVATGGLSTNGSSLPATDFANGASVWAHRTALAWPPTPTTASIFGIATAADQHANVFVMYTDGNASDLGCACGGSTGNQEWQVMSPAFTALGPETFAFTLPVGISTTPATATAYYRGVSQSFSRHFNVGGANLSFATSNVVYLGPLENEIVHAGGIWNRALSAQEVLWLDKEPYAMLRPIVSRRTYSIPAAGGGGGGRRPFIFFLQGPA